MVAYRLLITDDDEVSYKEYVNKAEALQGMTTWANSYKFDVDGSIDKGFQITIDTIHGKALVETENEIIGFACIFPIPK